jgi:hypothetical protein
MRSMRTDVTTTKLIRMHIGGAGVKMWFGILVYRGKSIKDRIRRLERRGVNESQLKFFNKTWPIS